MVRKWMIPDINVNVHDPTPELGPFKTVTYKKKRSEADVLSSRKRQSEYNEYLNEINDDPELKYAYEKEVEQRSCVARLTKNRELRNKLGLIQKRDVVQYVKDNWNNTREPHVIYSRGNSNHDSENKNMTFRQRLRHVRTREESKRLSEIERRADEGVFAQKHFDKEFIDLVKSARNSQNMTHEQLASKLNRSVGDVKTFENGEMLFNGGFKSLLIWKLALDA